MFYATHDADWLKISEGAHIASFETEEEARKYLLNAFDEMYWKLDTIGYAAGNYGDCWIKVMREPGDNEPYFEPFTRDQLIIRGPGQHPGGHAWWIEPCVEVMVVECIEEVD